MLMALVAFAYRPSVGSQTPAAYRLQSYSRPVSKAVMKPQQAVLAANQIVIAAGLTPKGHSVAVALKDLPENHFQWEVRYGIDARAIGG